MTVDMATDMPVLGTWASLWSVAQTLNTACTYYKTPNLPTSAVTGGKVDVHGVLITLERLLLGEGGNGSSVAVA